MKFRRVARDFAIVAFAIVLLAGGFYSKRSYWRSDEDDPAPFSPSMERGKMVSTEDYRLSGPYTHQNLTIFLVHGPDALDGKPFLTLQEALEQKKAIVHETGSVNQLTIENLSSDQDVYVQSGDVVKGGNQDRTLPYDAVVGPKSGHVPIDSFCVEQGRWAKRGDEESKEFERSISNVGNIKAMKLSLFSSASERDGSSQGEVWRSVAQTQERLSKKLGKSVESDASQTSLQLTLENPEVRAAIEPYRRALGSVIEKKSDVIGFVAAVNGRVISADIYASQDLFRKLWPKLLEGCAIESFIESDVEPTFGKVREEDVRAFLRDAENIKPTSEVKTERTYVQSRQSWKVLLQESCDRTRDNLVLHRSFVTR